MVTGYTKSDSKLIWPKIDYKHSIFGNYLCSEKTLPVKNLFQEGLNYVKNFKWRCLQYR